MNTEQPRMAGESLPAIMHVPDMLLEYGIKSATFYARLKLGHYDRFEILPRVGLRRAWDGALIQKSRQAPEAIRDRDSSRVWGRKRLGA